MQKHPAVHKSASDGEVSYRFERKVSAQKAFHLFMEAKKRGVPNGSVLPVL